MTLGEVMASGGASPTTGSVGDWYYSQAAFSLLAARQVPRHSPVAELSPRRLLESRPLGGGRLSLSPAAA